MTEIIKNEHLIIEIDCRKFKGLYLKRLKTFFSKLADLLEVIHALAKIHGSSIEEVEKIRVDKKAKRGGFSDKVYLFEGRDE